MADAMVNNKQVNFWRGDMTPPTIYHIWIKDNSKMLLYDGEKWVVFLDNKEIIDILDKVQQLLDEMQAKIDEIVRSIETKERETAELPQNAQHRRAQLGREIRKLNAQFVALREELMQNEV